TGSSYGGYNAHGGSYGRGFGEQQPGRRNPYGASRFDNLGAGSSGSRSAQGGAQAGGQAFSNTYATPGWQRAQKNRTEATDRNWGSRSGHAVERIGYGEVDSGYGAGAGSVKGRTIDG